jgi:hypothetical protein
MGLGCSPPIRATRAGAVNAAVIGPERVTARYRFGVQWALIC